MWLCEQTMKQEDDKDVHCGGSELLFVFELRIEILKPYVL